jgi:hypothetical protein
MRKAQPGKRAKGKRRARRKPAREGVEALAAGRDLATGGRRAHRAGPLA